MRSLFTLALGFLWAAAPSLSGAFTGANAPVGRVAQRLEGTWECRGPVRGSTSREVYARAGENRLVLHNAVHTARGVSGVVIETFGYDPQTATWKLSAPMNRFFDLMQLGAQGWRDQQWVFTGTQTLQNVVRPTRIVYTSLGPDVYRREHQSEENGVWQADGAFVCRRISPARARFVPAIAIQRTPATITPKHVALTAQGAQPAAAPSPAGTDAARGRDTTDDTEAADATDTADDTGAADATDTVDETGDAASASTADGAADVTGVRDDTGASDATDSADDKDVADVT